MTEQEAKIELEAIILRDKVDRIEHEVYDGYVSRDELAPIRRVIYGMVGMILVFIIGALISVLQGTLKPGWWQAVQRFFS